MSVGTAAKDSIERDRLDIKEWTDVISFTLIAFIFSNYRLATNTGPYAWGSFSGRMLRRIQILYNIPMGNNRNWWLLIDFRQENSPSYPAILWSRRAWCGEDTMLFLSKASVLCISLISFKAEHRYCYFDANPKARNVKKELSKTYQSPYSSLDTSIRVSPFFPQGSFIGHYRLQIIQFVLEMTHQLQGFNQL